MAKTLTVAAVNYLPKLRTSSVRITEQLRKTGVMSFLATTDNIADAPGEGSEVVYKDDTRFLFGGYITKVTNDELGIASQYTHSVEVSGYDSIFNNKIIARGYTDKTLAYIVADIITDFVGASYGFNVTNVATGPTIETISFDHISVRDAFKKLEKLTGYIWWVDYEKNLYFQLETATAAPEIVTDTSANIESINIAYDTTQVRNDVTVIGSADGYQSLDPITETFIGDSELRSWVLEAKPSEVISIKVNTVSQQFSLDVNEREADVFVYSYSGQSFKQTEAQTTLTASDTIEISYYPRLPIIERKEDTTSIAFFAAKDGGDGHYLYTIKDTSIGSIAEAGDRAQQELNDYADALVEGTIVTRTGLLTAGSYFAPGQALTVNLPSYGLSTDTVFTIQEVRIAVSEGDTTEYQYTIKFGGKPVGLKEFLEDLAAKQGKGTEVADATEILIIKSVKDTMEAAEIAPTIIIETPPYIWGPSGSSPVGKWNLAEWS